MALIPFINWQDTETHLPEMESDWLDGDIFQSYTRVWVITDRFTVHEEIDTDVYYHIHKGFFKYDVVRDHAYYIPKPDAWTYEPFFDF